MDKLPATGLSVILNDLTPNRYSFKKNWHKKHKCYLVFRLFLDHNQFNLSRLGPYSSGFQRLAIFTRGVNGLEMTEAAPSEPDAEEIWMSVMVNNCLQTGSRADPPPLKIPGRLIYRGAPDAEPSRGRDNVRFCCLHCMGGKFAVVITTSRTIFVHVSAPRR